MTSDIELVRIHARALHSFSVIVRAWYKERGQGRRPKYSMRECGRMFGLTNDEMSAVQSKFRSKVWRGPSSNEMMTRFRVVEAA